MCGRSVPHKGTEVLAGFLVAMAERPRGSGKSGSHLRPAVVSELPQRNACGTLRLPMGVCQSVTAPLLATLPVSRKRSEVCRV